MERQRKTAKQHRRGTFSRRLQVFLTVVCLAVCVVGIYGCGSHSAGSTGKADASNANAAIESVQDGVYKIYDLGKDADSIESYDYEAQADTPTALISELLGQLSTQPEDVQTVPAISSFRVNSAVLNDKGVLTLDFSAEYLGLDTTKEAMTRAAIVSTLCEINGVEGVMFSVEGAPLKDEKDQQFGVMKADNFVLNPGKDINAYEKTSLHLYFADQSGTKLIEVTRSVVYNSNISMDKLVVDQLIKGPNGTGIYPTINPDTKLLGVTSNDDACYVNFDATFMTEPYNVLPDVVIYSIVNSLTELPNIRQVQFSINGDSSGTFMEKIPLSAPFTRDISLVEDPDDAVSDMASTAGN